MLLKGCCLQEAEARGKGHVQRPVRGVWSDWRILQLVMVFRVLDALVVRSFCTRPIPPSRPRIVRTCTHEFSRG